MDWINKIKENKLSGASELKKIASECILDFISKPYSKEELTDLLQKLEKTQPSMATIKNLVNLINDGIKNLDKIEDINKKIKEIINMPSIDIESLIKNISPILEDKKTVLTYSYSRTVYEILKNFTHLSVYVPECRPNYEGRRLAIDLHNAGIEVIVIIDAAIFKFIKNCNVVILGADRIMEDLVINKIGTFGIALAAQKLKIPIYVVCGFDKFLSKKLSPFKEDLKNGKEIWENTNIKVLNLYFEATPIDYFTGIITDKGIISPQDIINYF